MTTEKTVEKTEKALTKTKVKGDDFEALAATLGIGVGDEALTFEKVSSGGVAKWVDMRAFQSDPNAPQGKAVTGNGKAFSGVLLGMGAVEVGEDDNGEIDETTGVKVRYFYTLKLVSPCPVTFKDDSGADQAAIAEPGDIVSIGERFALKTWRDLVKDGGSYAFVIRPHSRIKRGSRTMWTFDIWKKVLRAPANRTELVANPRDPKALGFRS
jgi:hypothetical protein